LRDALFRLAEQLPPTVPAWTEDEKFCLQVKETLDEIESMPVSAERSLMIPSPLKECASLPADPEKLARNKKMFEERREELARQFPDEWIAFNDGRVTAHSKSFPFVQVDGERHSFLVFPSNPSLVFMGMCLFTATMPLDPSGEIGIEATIQVADSTSLFKCPERGLERRSSPVTAVACVSQP